MSPPGRKQTDSFKNADSSKADLQVNPSIVVMPFRFLPPLHLSNMRTSLVLYSLGYASMDRS